MTLRRLEVSIRSRSALRSLGDGAGRQGGAVRAAQQGFTLTELLVVIGIIVVLITLVLGGLGVAQRKATLTRAKADLQSISMALEAYKGDFGSYPVASRPGDHILARFLVGPGMAAEDGYDGPGYKLPSGRVQQPYLTGDNPKVVKIGSYWEFLDPYEQPIEYYPRRAEVNVGLVRPRNDRKPGVYRFHEEDGTASADLLRTLLGDTNRDNKIGAGETLRFSGPFILMSKGGAPEWSDPQSLKDAPHVFNFDR